MIGSKAKGITIAAVATMAFAASSGVAAAGEGSPDQGASLDVVAQTYRDAFPSMSEAEARAAAAGTDARKELYSALMGTAAATYGGAWFDPPSGVLHVNATTAATAASAEQLGRQLGVSVRTHRVSRSLAQLERQAQALRTGNTVLARSARGQVGIDVQSNRVVVAVPGAQTRSFSAANTPAGVSVVKDPNLRTVADAGCTSRAACDWTIRAGAMIGRSIGSNSCSVGFTARTSANVRYTYTAGHCSSGNGFNWYTGGQLIGPMSASINSGVLDAAIIRVSNSWFASDSGGEIYHETAAGRTVPLNGVAPSVNYMLEGETVCLSANYTQPNGPNLCGVIGAVSDPAVRGMTRVDRLDACPGDSGGGWYWLTSAGRRIGYGLHSRSDPGCHGSENGTRSWYSPIGAVKQQWTPWLDVEVRP